MFNFFLQRILLSFILLLNPMQLFGEEVTAAPNCHKSLLTIMHSGDNAIIRFWKRRLENFARLPWANRSLETYSKRGELTGKNFWQIAASEIQLIVGHRGNALTTIPRSGPLIIVANHPLGFTDGVLLNMLLQHQLGRSDVKTIANSELLQVFPQLSDQIIPIGTGPKSTNARALMQAKQHLNNGGALIIFPAGDVEKFRWQLSTPTGKYLELPWQNGACHLAQITNATVVPIFIHGHNSALFHAVSYLAEGKKKMLYLREFLRQTNQTVPVVIGPNLKIPVDSNPAIVTPQLQNLTLLLGGNQSHGHSLAFRRSTRKVPIAQKNDDYLAQLSQLERTGKLLELVPLKNGLRVVYGQGGEMPEEVLNEIGRTRELTFRHALEGTGQGRDLDSYDLHYLQFLILNEGNQIVGGYRVGEVDKILQTKGLAGIYSHNQFQYGADFFRQLDGGVLELGRAFVIPEYQNSPALFLVWRALAEFLYANPQYRHLLGAVSIPDAYADSSQAIILQYLAQKHPTTNLGLVQATEPRHAYRPDLGNFSQEQIDQTASLLGNLEQLDAMVAAIEGNKGSRYRGAPPLIGNYFGRLNAQLINVDHDQAFGTVDALIYVDTHEIPDGQFALFLLSKKRAVHYRQLQENLKHNRL